MEFKELLAYAKRWIFLILGIAIGGAVVAYFAAEYIPSKGGGPRYTATGEFELPQDPYRIISYAAGDSSATKRLLLDPNTETASVTTSRNMASAARYFCVLEKFALELEATGEKTPEGAPKTPGSATRPYEVAVQYLSERAVEVLGREGSASPEYYRVRLGDGTIGLDSIDKPERIDAIRVGRGPAGVTLRVEAILNSRNVMVTAANAVSYNDARIWVDAVLLAAKRESFQRLLAQFDSVIRAAETGVQRELEEFTVTGMDAAALQSAAQKQVEARLRTAEAVRRQRESMAEGATEGERVGFEYEPAPSFGPEATAVELRAYWGHIRREIESKHSHVATAVLSNASNIGSQEQQELELWNRELRRDIERISSADSALRGRLVNQEEFIAAEKARFESFRTESRLLEYSPNVAVISSEEMTRSRREIDSILRERRSLSLRLRPDHRDMIDVEARLGVQLGLWESAILQAFNSATQKLETERTTLREEAEAATRRSQSLLREVARLEGEIELIHGLSVLYRDSLTAERAALANLQARQTAVQSAKRARGLQSPVIDVTNFAPLASAAGVAAASYKYQVAAIVFVVLLIGSAVAIYVWMLSRSRITTEYDVRRHVNLPVLAKFAKRDSDQVSLLNVGPRSGISEAFSTLATLVRSYSKELSLRSLLITSAVMEEGKTDISSNLGVALSRKGLRVLVVDADLHRSRVGSFFGADTEKGLIQYAEAGGKGELTDYVRSIPDGPDVLLPGGQIADPVKMLESDIFKGMMKQAEREYDFVIYDSPPVTRVGDALILAGEVDATILVCSCGDVSFADAAMAKRLLTNVHANLLGVVLNNSTDAHAREYYNYYAYGRESRRRVRKVVG